MAAELIYKGGSPSSRRWKYDVFLSFCGKDTRTSFADHLFNRLVQNGIRTFRDDEGLHRGGDISSELMEAIQISRIAIIVFSRNYASSNWCLGELVKILDCKKEGQIEKVMPVFYKVDPADVRRQRNTYAKAFKKHEERFKENMDKVEKWRAALTEAANLSGWNQAKTANGHEAELIKKIAEEVLTTVKQTRLHVAAHPIGLDSHIKHISCLLNGGRSDLVRIIGIYGSGGIGKTTIAKAVFNFEYKNFDGSCFLANVRSEVSSQQKGLVLLQKQLLSDVLKRSDIDTDIDNEHEGIIIIKEHLCYKRVLIVLDDVDEMEQFYELVGGHEFFGPGSRIIITTRDEYLLNRLDVDEKCKYRVQTMNKNDSLQLFSRHAFRQNHPFEEYVQLSNDVIDYAGGLPLALVVLGSLLYKRSQVEWESELKKLRKIPNGRILEKLEISYNALDDSNQTIFLDISCFFIGEDKNFVNTILDACGLDGEAEIKLLIERSLVTIDDKNRLHMHDIIRDMGRDIVRKQSPRKLGGRSRLWDDDDAIDLLINLTGTDAVEGLQFNLFRYNMEEVGPLIVEGFSKMPNLRLLEVDSLWSSIEIDLESSLQEWLFCFRKLVWLSWKGFPSKCIPNNFVLGNLVILDMQKSKLREVWKETKYLPKLKDLNLSHSSSLTCTPDFSGLLNLKKLILKWCESLVEVHESIECLKKLVILDLGYCGNLKNLPSGISKLVSLETLDISFCSKLDNMPKGIRNLRHLTMLDVSGTIIKEQPSSFGLLKSLVTFRHSLHDQIKYSKDLVSSLKHLALANCKLTGGDIPDDFWMLYSLESLNLSWNCFGSLPSCIGRLSKLQTLDLCYCRRLKSIQTLPSSLCSLNALGCRMLKMLTNLSNMRHLRMLDLSGCENLTKIEGLEDLKSAATIRLNYCVRLKNSDQKRILDIVKDLQKCNIDISLEWE